MLWYGSDLSDDKPSGAGTNWEGNSTINIFTLYQRFQQERVLSGEGIVALYAASNPFLVSKIYLNQRFQHRMTHSLSHYTIDITTNNEAAWINDSVFPQCCLYTMCLSERDTTSHSLDEYSFMSHKLQLLYHTTICLLYFTRNWW